jgi:omega-amidase
MKIALISLNQIWEDKKSNWSLCRKYIKDAADNRVDLIIFPETTLTGFSTNVYKIGENRANSETLYSFKKAAIDSNIAIIFGMVLEINRKYFNYNIFISSDGKVIGEYAKIHPFSYAGEDEYFSSGSEIEIVKYNGFNIGLSVCYDLRFPEIYSAMAKNSDLIINIANWPMKRLDHWISLLKARAIENQIFTVGVNRVGLDGNELEYSESSCIFNADGIVLSSIDLGDMHIYDVDEKWQDDYRNAFNTVNDRQVELYKRII